MMRQSSDISIQYGVIYLAKEEATLREYEKVISVRKYFRSTEVIGRSGTKFRPFPGEKLRIFPYGQLERRDFRIVRGNSSMGNLFGLRARAREPSRARLRAPARAAAISPYNTKITPQQLPIGKNSQFFARKGRNSVPERDYA